MDFATDTLEGLYHLADNSANYLWGNAVGAADYLSGHTLSDNFEYVQNINVQTNQTHDQIGNTLKADYDMGVSGFAEMGANYVGNSLSAIGEGWETGDVDKIRGGTKGMINTATLVVPAAAATKVGAVNALNKIDHYLDASKVANTLDKIEDVRVVEALSKANTPHIEMLLKESTVPKETLAQHLRNTDNYLQSKGIDSRLSEEFLEHGKWPEHLQIPRDPEFLLENGNINWEKFAPQNGYTLDMNGQAIREPFIPQKGEIIDRYGSPNGRYTSPVEDGVPYSYEKRSLPYVEDANMYHQYEVIGDFSKLEEYVMKSSNLELKNSILERLNRYELTFEDLKSYKGVAAEAFGKGNGGAIQYELVLSIEQLEILGLLKKIN